MEYPFIPADNEPSDCLQAFGDCRGGQILGSSAAQYLILEKITEQCRIILKEELTGIYLHGSLAMGCFNPKKSDIDLIVVIEERITDEQKMLLMEQIVLLNEQAPQKGIELSVIKKSVCKNIVCPTPFELHFSPVHLAWFLQKPEEYVKNMKGSDPDLPAHFMVIKHYGIVLWGAEIHEIFSDVSPKIYFESIWSDIASAEADVLENPVYVILNLCRTLAYVQEGVVLSKKAGGEWGREKLDEKYVGLIEKALESYLAETDEPTGIAADELHRFCREMIERIRKFSARND